MTSSTIRTDAALALLLALSPLAVRAQDAHTLHVRALAATCANCHGTDGRPVADSAVPGLAGLPADVLSQQMKAFRDGTRPSTVMQQIARGYTDAQVAQLATWFAAQPRNAPR